MSRAALLLALALAALPAAASAAVPPALGPEGRVYPLRRRRRQGAARRPAGDAAARRAAAGRRGAGGRVGRGAALPGGALRRRAGRPGRDAAGAAGRAGGDRGARGRARRRAAGAAPRPACCASDRTPPPGRSCRGRRRSRRRSRRTRSCRCRAATRSSAAARRGVWRTAPPRASSHPPDVLAATATPDGTIVLAFGGSDRLLALPPGAPAARAARRDRRGRVDRAAAAARRRSPRRPRELLRRRRPRRRLGRGGVPPARYGLGTGDGGPFEAPGRPAGRDRARRGGAPARGRGQPRAARGPARDRAHARRRRARDLRRAAPGEVTISSTFAGAAGIEVRSGGEVVTSAIAEVGAGETTVPLPDPPPPGTYTVAVRVTAADGREARHRMRVVTLRRLSRVEALREARRYERRSRVRGLEIDLRRCERAGTLRFSCQALAVERRPGPDRRRCAGIWFARLRPRRPPQPCARSAEGLPRARAGPMRAALLALALLAGLPGRGAGRRARRVRARLRGASCTGSEGGFRWTGRETLDAHQPRPGAARGRLRPALGQRRARLPQTALRRDLEPRGRRARRPDAARLHRRADQAGRADRTGCARQRRLRRRHPRAAQPARPLRPRRQARGAALQRDPGARAPRGRRLAARQVVRLGRGVDVPRRGVARPARRARPGPDRRPGRAPAGRLPAASATAATTRSRRAGCARARRRWPGWR